MIPSLLQIPSAVSDSKLHSVLPNNGKGDFTFDRSTGATRINKDGLIEEVGYFSSELVQNGNFSELGSELIVNGDFATTNNWNAQTSWSINNGKAVADLATNRYIQQNFTGGALTSGKTYKIVFTVSDYVTGNLKAQLGGGGSTQDLATINANGTYTYYAVATNNATNLRFKGISQGGGFTGKIDNVSVKQVDPNSEWSLGTGWSYGDSKAISDSTVAFQSLTQFAAISNSNGKTFKVKFTISDYQSGGVALYISGFINNSFFIAANGDYEYNLTVSSGTSGNVEFLTHSGGFKGVISNVSIVEVQGDRPRLSYDITNGVVEDKPHLLLEPSSTNSIIFSNDLSQSVYTGNGFSNAVYGQVGVNGTNDAWLFTKSGASESDIYNTAFTGTYTFSFFVKKEANKGVKIYNFGDTVQQSTINIETGAYVAGVNTVTIQEFPNDWLRVAQTLTISNGKYYLYVSNGTETQIASSIVVQYFQIEQQAFPTTYIPTAGTTITRAAETCNNSKPSVNSTEGVLYAEIAALADDQTGRFFALSDGSSSNRVRLGYQPSVSNRFRAIVVSGASTTVDMNDGNTTLTDITQYNKIAFKYKVNDFALYFNGTEVKTDTSGAVPTSLNLLEFNNAASTPGSFFYGKVKGLAVYNEALSESQLMQLTGVTASSIYSNFVTRTASFTVEALNEVKKVIDNL